MVEGAVPCHLTGTVLQLVHDAGGDARSLAERFGLPGEAVGARGVRITVALRAELFDAAATLVDDPFFGLHALAAFRPGHFGLLEHVTGAAATVDEAHEMLCHYGPLLGPLARFTWTRLRDGRSALRHRILGAPHAAGRHGNELMMAGLIDWLRRLARIRVDRVWFAHPRPVDTGELCAFFGVAHVEFDAVDNGYVLGPGDASLPLTSRDPALSASFRQPATAALDTRSPPRDFLDEVRAAVLASLPRGGSLLAQVAHRLDTSPRTMQRHLLERGVRFTALVTEVRRAESQRLITGTPLSLSTIARELGYSDLANFLRAFRRWTGTTPTVFRDRAGAGCRAEG
jgi:AraC-like DNA-binding protein